MPSEFEDGTYITDEHGLYRVLASNRRTLEVWLEDCSEPECTVCTSVPELIGFRVVNQQAQLSTGLVPVISLASNDEAVND